MKKVLLILLIIGLGIASNAQTEEEPYVKKGMLIIYSTKNYNAAKKFAKQAAKKLALKLDLRNLSPNKQEGLTFSKADCDSNNWEYPCYVARGRWDDGEYISIEHTKRLSVNNSNYESDFKENLYVVIAASGDKSITQPALQKAKKIYTTAYVKKANVYIGCIH